MRRDEPAGAPLEPAVPEPAVPEPAIPEPAVPQPAVAEQPVQPGPPRRAHLVAMITRGLAGSDAGASGTGVSGTALRARWWNPHERRWNEADYDSIEGLRRRHVDEEGWELLQEQGLDAPLAVELIFRAHRVDFTRPSREQILRDIGMTPDDVNQLLEDVDRRQDRE